jgi:hypothetical protein
MAVMTVERTYGSAGSREAKSPVLPDEIQHLLAHSQLADLRVCVAVPSRTQD